MKLFSFAGECSDFDVQHVIRALSSWINLLQLLPSFLSSLFHSTNSLAAALNFSYLLGEVFISQQTPKKYTPNQAEWNSCWLLLIFNYIGKKFPMFESLALLVFPSPSSSSAIPKKSSEESEKIQTPNPTEILS